MSDIDFEIIGINRNCDEKEIKRKYKEISLFIHPDKHNDNLISTHLFKIISRSYQNILGKKDASRNEYDSLLVKYNKLVEKNEECVKKYRKLSDSYNEKLMLVDEYRELLDKNKERNKKTRDEYDDMLNKYKKMSDEYKDHKNTCDGKKLIEKCEKYKKRWKESIKLNESFDEKYKKLSRGYEKIESENHKLKIEHGKLKIEDEKLKIEYEKLKIEYEKLKIEYDKLKIEHDKLTIEHNKLSKKCMDSIEFGKLIEKKYQNMSEEHFFSVEFAKMNEKKYQNMSEEHKKFIKKYNELSEKYNDDLALIKEYKELIDKNKKCRENAEIANEKLKKIIERNNELIEKNKELNEKYIDKVILVEEYKELLKNRKSSYLEGAGKVVKNLEELMKIMEKYKTFDMNIDENVSVLEANIVKNVSILEADIDGLFTNNHEKIVSTDNVRSEKIHANSIDSEIYSFEDIQKEHIEKIQDHQSITVNGFKARIHTLFLNGIKKMKESRILKTNEKYVHCINHCRWVNKTSGNILHGTCDVVIILGVVTNYSNFTWLEIKDKMRVFDTHFNNATTEHRIYDLDVPFNSQYIDVLTAIKPLSPQTLDGFVFGDNVRFFDYYDNNCKIFYKEMYDIIVKILDMNKKN